MSLDQHTVHNFGRNVSFQPKISFEPVSEAEVLLILAEHRGSNIRVIGRLHSYSEAASCEDVLLDLHCPMNATMVKSLYAHLPEFQRVCADSDPNQVFRNEWVSQLLFSEDSNDRCR